MVVTFFGHRDTPNNIRLVVEKVLIDIIKNNDKVIFYIGNQGNFDYIVINILKKLKGLYSNFEFFIVLAYMPNASYKNSCFSDLQTIVPDNLEYAHPKYAIEYRNRWMIQRCDLVITYVKSEIGGAAKFRRESIKKQKSIINIADCFDLY